MPRVKKIVFFGTPEFAVPTLDALVEAGSKPVMVVTQPDRPAGRGRALRESPVGARAQELALEVVKPESVREPEFVETMQGLSPDLFIVVAFGQIFPPELLEVPANGCINLHASLLPKYRGAAPIQAAIAHGERDTGVTTMWMEEGLDSGPILGQSRTRIGSYETTPELSERLAEMGAELVLETLRNLEADELKSRKQDEKKATYAPQLTREHGKVNWALTAQEIANRLRAYTPWPGMYAHLRGRNVKILEAMPLDWAQAPDGFSGSILGLRQGRLAVLCGDNTVLGISELQRPGKKALDATEFARGERLRPGTRMA
jgi:methionyl-tRNA formyltransferase